MEELPSSIHDAIKRHCAVGDELADAGKLEEAFSEYGQAWELVPEPRNKWNASTWILAAIADVSFLGGYRTSAREALEYAMICPDGPGNPFLHLRYGQVLLDSDEPDAAADQLMRAYMAGGPEVFEDEDPRYLEFLRTRAIID